MLDKEIRLQALREFTDCFYPVWSWKLDRFFNVIQSGGRGRPSTADILFPVHPVPKTAESMCFACGADDPQ